MSNKIKVTLDCSIIYSLNSDMLEYGDLKSNGEINKNSFYCNIILSMYKNRLIEKEKFREFFSNFTNDLNLLEKISSSTIDFKNNVSKPIDSSYKENIIIYTNSSNANIINEIVLNGAGHSNVSLSAYFRSLFEEFSYKTSIEKERILYGDLIQTINKATFECKILKLRYNNIEYIISPDLAFEDLNRYHIYLYGIDISNSNPIGFRLSKIKDLIVLNKYHKTDVVDWDNSESRYLSGDVESTDELIKISYKLTDEGLIKYNKELNKMKYKINVHTNEGICCVTSTENFFFNYFISYGKDIDIISPLSIKERFVNFYKTSYESMKIKV